MKTLARIASGEQCAATRNYALHPGVGSTPLSDYEVDHDRYDEARDQWCEVEHSQILLLERDGCVNHGDELAATGHWSMDHQIRRLGAFLEGPFRSIIGLMIAETGQETVTP